MKNVYKILILALVAAISSCRPNDATRDYGFAKVYIPQATVTGLDNSYPIPLGPLDQNSVYACKYDGGTGRLGIALGVIRSGYLARQQSFSVTLSYSQAETDRKLAEYAEKAIPAQALPTALCTIPSSIQVEEGTNGGTCYVEVDIKALAAQQGTLVTADGGYVLLLLGLEITNPTAYELSENNTRVVIVLDLGSEYWSDEIHSLFP